MTTAFRIHPDDNVATLLGDGVDVVMLIGGDGVALNQPVAMGHKVALADIAVNQSVVKFGIPIGTAAIAIRAGDWVHLHNCTSRFDERSGGFDVVTGAAKDMAYD
jgi:hypothetical protein